MTAWFNILFNGEEAMKEELKNLENSYQENYSEVLPVEPLPRFESKEYEYDEALTINPNRQSSSFFNKARSGNLLNNEESSRQGFEKSEEKAIKAIEKHSMQIRKVERNSIISRAYLLLGKARYYQGKTFPALDALNYAQKNLPKTKWDPEIDLYLALAHIQGKNNLEAEKRLSELYYDEKGKVSKDKRALVSAITAQYLIDAKNDSGAIEALNKALVTVKGKQKKARYHFILGQLYSKQNKLNRAAEHFTEVYRLKPGFDMEVESQIAIAENFDSVGNNYLAFKNHLLDIAKKGNYFSRKNELHYAVGEVARRAGKIKDAEEYLRLSLAEEKVSDDFVRAKAYESFAKLEFERENYIYAKAYYDSALTKIQYPKYRENLTEKNKTLATIVNQHYLIQKNDSILRIARMPKEKQSEFFTSYIEKLKQEEAKKQEEEAAEQYSFLNETKAPEFASTFGEGANGKFYFYNQSAIGFGQNEFRRIWGERNLGDNWRYGNGAAGKTTEELEAELLGQNEEGNPRRYDLSFYLDQIPKQPRKLDSIRIERDSTELKLGIAYFDAFDNHKLAMKTLTHLVQAPPKRGEDEELAYYNLYRIAKEKQNPLAESYAQAVLTKYPKGLYAEYIRNPESLLSAGNTEEALKDYEAVYEGFKRFKYQETMDAYTAAQEKFNNQPILAKYALLNALSLGKLKGEEERNKALREIVVQYRQLEEARIAKLWLENVKIPEKNKPEKAKETLDLPKGKKLFR